MLEQVVCKEPKLAQTFVDMLRASNLDDPIRRLIRVNYMRSDRYYHNTEHLLNMWNTYLANPPKDIDPLILLDAILFHDIVYEPGDSHNEINSAQVWRNYANDIGCGKAHNQAVYAMILASKFGAYQDDDPEILYFLDLDLISLAAPWDKFVINNRNIDREMQTAKDFNAKIYAQQRLAFWRMLASKSRIYRSNYIQPYYEQAAYTNVWKMYNQLKLEDQINEPIAE